MPTNAPTKIVHRRRILGRVAQQEFFGREDALDEIVAHADRLTAPHGLLLLSAPSVGTSELLRQTYDELFQRYEGVIPIYFQLTRDDTSSRSAARHFLQTFLTQLISYRRRKPNLSDASLTLRELLAESAVGDLEWIERLLEDCESEQLKSDEREYVRLCLSVRERATSHGARTLVMIDGLHVAEQLSGDVSLGQEIAQTFTRAETPFVLAGLRRRVLDLVYGDGGNFDTATSIHLQELGDDDARAIVESLAKRTGVVVNDQTRDLIVQQFGGNPSLITSMIVSAQDKRIPLDSFRTCQGLYVDELMGGRFNRYCSTILEGITPNPSTRHTLIRVLHESMMSDSVKSPLEGWNKKLHVEMDQFSSIMRALHVHELISVNASVVQKTRLSPVWQDYLRAQYRLEIATETRAKVFADMLIDTLKRAPKTMARHYRRASALGLRELLTLFNCQQIPSSLLNYDRFTRSYKGVDPEELHAGLDNEIELILLPQIVHAASCESFHPLIQEWIDEERCAVAYGFDAGHYDDASEIVWIAAEIESKLEAGRGITEIWCDRLEGVARACEWNRVRLWLVAPEGFSVEARDLLAEREVYCSSRAQLELLTGRLGSFTSPLTNDDAYPDEFEMVIPMGDETELIAASTVEQIARRKDFRPEAINQIKTAVVEACINAMEHSLSPDRKIYQRFRLESDKLVVTVSSRGVIPSGATSKHESNGDESGDEPEGGEASGRRGWGLKLIRTLMDEVEFERVDDGTRLKMTKYLKRP